MVYTECLFFSRETGTVIIGMLDVIGGAVGIVLGASGAGVLKPGPVHWFPENQDYWQRILFNVCIFIAVASSIKMLCGLFLLIGVRKKIRALFWPWMIYAILNGFIAVGIISLETYVLVILNQIITAIFTAILATIIVFFYIYFVAVVVSEYKFISENKTKQITLSKR